MTKVAGPNCPKCDGPLLHVAAVFKAFESAIDVGAKVIQNAAPVSQVFFCGKCKRLVWMGRHGKKRVMAKKKPRKRPKA